MDLNEVIIRKAAEERDRTRPLAGIALAEIDRLRVRVAELEGMERRAQKMRDRRDFDEVGSVARHILGEGGVMDAAAPDQIR